jgi:hypothetical protein
MKAIYLERPGLVYVRDVKKPVASKGEILVRMQSMAICGSDVAAYRGVNPLVSYPRIIGHELAGVIESMATENTAGRSLHVGQRVVLEPYVSCGVCYPCLIGRSNSCVDLKVLGVHIEGGMSEYFAYSEKLVHPIPDTFSALQAACVEPVTIALHSVHRGAVRAGEHVVVFGAGPIGNLIAQVVKSYGAIPIVVDVLSERLKLSKELGADFVINALEMDVAAMVKDMTGGRMAECVIEATGALPVIRQTIDVVANAGRVVLTGHPKSDVELPTGLFIKKELDVRGSRTSVGEFPEAIAMIATGNVNVDRIVSASVDFEELPQYLMNMADEPQRYVKVVGIIG